MSSQHVFPHKITCAVTSPYSLQMNERDKNLVQGVKVVKTVIRYTAHK